jgi:hypothetical protein
LKVFCIIEEGIIKEKCFDFHDHQPKIQSLLQQRSIHIKTA